ncbi:MAG TPA: hypothetical protein VEK73_06490 [Xanthobacteraceae bacterium]|nr:hypothetical protein [Xanthobacteraceae bacterium]
MRFVSTRRAAVALIASAAFALAGCGGVELSGWNVFEKSAETFKVDPNKYPIEYKNELLNFLRNELPDPTNIRGAFLTDPTLTPFGNDNRYAVCLRYNSRSLDGQYQGSKDTIAIFYGAKINQIRDATKEECGAAAYRPFPELEALKRLDGK